MITKTALRAVLYELAVVDRVGLVSLSSSGSHKDMDSFKFIDSSLALVDYFELCAKKGNEFNSNDFSKLFEELRELGKEAEKEMYLATKNTNTHKGTIFSLGILCASVSYMHKEKVAMTFENISYYVSKIAKKSMEDFSKGSENSYGLTLFRNHNMSGIRGELSNAFPSLKKVIFEDIEINIRRERSYSDIFLNTLIHIMQYTEDSNIFGRAEKLHKDGLNKLKEVQKKAKDIIDSGGVFNDEGKRKFDELKEYMEEYKLSPGGSADLLICTIFIYFITKELS